MQLGIGAQAAVDQVITQQAEFLHEERCLAAKGGLYAAYNKCHRVDAIWSQPIETIAMPLIETSTERLLLRAWRDSDLPALVALNADAEVMRHFPAPMDAEQSAQLLARIRAHFDEHGFGFWALERRDTGELIGVTGLAQVGFDAPFVPAVEIGWRLARAHWRQGYASEAARASLAVAFEQLGLDEVLSFTVPANLPSQAVMRSIGMQRDDSGDFLHPRVPSGHPLQPHVLYRISREQWEAQR